MLHNEKTSWQILDLLQLSRQENDCRIFCKETLTRARRWKKNYRHQTIQPHFVYKKIEGMFLLKQARDAVYFYKTMRRIRKTIFSDYVSRLPSSDNR